MQNEEQQEQQPFYFWAENLEEYESDNLAYDKEKSENPVIEIKRLNFFIGKNNSGKSRFLRRLFSEILAINIQTNLNSKLNFNKIKELKQLRYTRIHDDFIDSIKRDGEIGIHDYLFLYYCYS